MATLSRALNGEEARLVEQACGGGEGDVLIATAARLYLAHNQREFTHHQTGAVCLFRQRSGTFCLRLIDARSGRTLWEFALIGDVKYQADRPFFHSFVGQTCMVGLSFADEFDAATFLERVLHKEKYAPRLSNSNLSSTAAPLSGYGSKNPSPRASNSNIASGIGSARVSSVEKVAERKDSKSEGGGGLFGFGRKNTAKGSKGKLDKSMISAPTNFEHVSHVGYSAQSGFSVDNIPLEWKLIFQKAGITDEQLQDKKQRKVVKQFMRDNANLVSGGGASGAGASRRAPPPPPPSSSRNRAPPPPPPSRMSVSARPVEPGPVSPPARAAPPPPSIPERSAPPIPTRGAPPVPVIPSRSAPPPPSIPTRSAPVPPPSSSMHAGGPPPPPPPPALGAPPPPPLMPTPTSRPTPLSSGANKLPPVTDTRANLMDAIRGGAKLKSTADALQDAPPPPASGGGDDLADALRNALQNRVKAVAGSDSDSEDDDDDDGW